MPPPQPGPVFRVRRVSRFAKTDRRQLKLRTSMKMKMAVIYFLALSRNSITWPISLFGGEHRYRLNREPEEVKVL